jgi:ribosome-binding factor A
VANQARQRRVADQIQRELAEIIRGELKDPRVGMITLTSVDVSPDLAHAKVYFTTLAEDADRDEALKGLKRASGFLRSELGRRVKVHNTPELHFVFDASVERGVRLSRLIDDAVASDKPVE